jgi:hypothetical protein
MQVEASVLVQRGHQVWPFVAEWAQQLGLNSVRAQLPRRLRPALRPVEILLLPKHAAVIVNRLALRKFPRRIHAGAVSRVGPVAEDLQRSIIVPILHSASA